MWRKITLPEIFSPSLIAFPTSTLLHPFTPSPPCAARATKRCSRRLTDFDCAHSISYSSTGLYRPDRCQPGAGPDAGEHGAYGLASRSGDGTLHVGAQVCVCVCVCMCARRCCPGALCLHFIFPSLVRTAAPLPVVVWCRSSPTITLFCSAPVFAQEVVRGQERGRARCRFGAVRSSGLQALHRGQRKVFVVVVHVSPRLRACA